ncbi:hypothetical protein [Streptomyces sp. NPDC101178]|uniref:hypothetical protein n=1 Tax=Streptomyces sp. NPDC101178 TaxID=3366124 RepID=UPI003830DF6E
MADRRDPLGEIVAVCRNDRPPPGSDPAARTGMPPDPAAGELPHLRRLAAAAAVEPPDVLFETAPTMIIARVEAMR